MQFCRKINYLYLLILTFSVVEVGSIPDFFLSGCFPILDFAQFGILSIRDFFDFGILFFRILSVNESHIFINKQHKFKLLNFLRRETGKEPLSDFRVELPSSSPCLSHTVEASLCHSHIWLFYTEESNNASCFFCDKYHKLSRRRFDLCTPRTECLICTWLTCTIYFRAQ